MRRHRGRLSSWVSSIHSNLNFPELTAVPDHELVRSYTNDTGHIEDHLLLIPCAFPRNLI